MTTSVRTRLLGLLTAFALVAVLSAGGTIYGVRQLLAGASAAFEQAISRGLELEQLRLAAREQAVGLREMVIAGNPPTENGAAERDAFFQRLEHLADFPPEHAEGAAWSEVAGLAAKLRDLSGRAAALVEAGRRAEAAELLASTSDRELWSALDTRLHNAHASVEQAREAALDRLVTTHSRLLLLAALVGVSEAALLAIGAMLIRRWLMRPVARLKQAAEEFQGGNLHFRVEAAGRDELGMLADSLNSMAGSLVAAQAELRTSEAKYRALFENLRDAVVICDDRGRITDYRDSTTGLLGPCDRTMLGQDLGAWWSQWFRDDLPWPHLLETVLRQGRSVNRTDRPFQARHEATVTGESGTRVDVVAYPVEYGDGRYMAVVLRDVTERHRLQHRARQAETIQATVTFAQGIAHDFNNLLASAIGIFQRLRFPAAVPPEEAERFATALRACRQAAALARRVLDYSGYDQGHPQPSSLGETVRLILQSLDEWVSSKIRIHLECLESPCVRIDHDQLTQVVLNLVRNACEAMPDGGDLRITVGAAIARDPAEQGVPRPHAILTVADTGQGMSDEVKRRLFEPFFSTRTDGSPHRRGLGLAVVYAVVKNAGGFIEVESQLGAGTRVRVFLPGEPAGCAGPASNGRRVSAGQPPEEGIDARLQPNPSGSVV